MKFGINIFPTDYSIGIVELAKASEDLGFESIWAAEHTHIPVSSVPRTFAKEYLHVYDPFVALSAAAAVTSTLKVGTGLSLVIEQDPIVIAKKVGSLDHLSGGRFIFGVGGGWNQQEMMNHGTKPSLRWKILRERVLAMKEIWTTEEAEYHGEFVDFDPIWSWPKPVQSPYPPILIGGDGPRTLDRVVEYGDGWIPLGGTYQLDGSYRAPRPSETSLADRIKQLNEMSEAAGRGKLPVSIYGIEMDEAAITQHIEDGVDRGIFWLPSAEASVVLPLLKKAAEVTKKFA